MVQCDYICLLFSNCSEKNKSLPCIVSTVPGCPHSLAVAVGGGGMGRVTDTAMGQETGKRAGCCDQAAFLLALFSIFNGMY